MSVFRRDFTAGLALSVLLAPGRGWVRGGGWIGAIHGLCVTFVPLIVYATLGPSRVLVIGPDSTLVPLIATTVLPLAGSDPSRAAGLAGVLALIGPELTLSPQDFGTYCPHPRHRKFPGPSPAYAVPSPLGTPRPPLGPGTVAPGDRFR
jgi:hypothetical protein